MPAPRTPSRPRLGLEALEGRNLLTTLPYGDILPGTVAGGDVAEFTFTAQAGDIFSLALTSTATQAGFAAFANVYAPSGTNIDNFFATGQRYFYPDESGVYTVQLHDSDFAQDGAFTLGLEGITPVSPDPTPLAPGGIVGGSIDAPIDVKQFTFSGAAGDVISLALTSTATQSGFAAFANVYAPSGSNIDNFFATGQRYLTLPETGVYMVQMHDSDYAQKGSFKIGLESISPISPNPAALLPGGIVGGGIDAPIDVKQYTFTGHRGDVVSLALTSAAIDGGFAAFANLYAPSGANVDNFFATGQRYLTLPEDGVYMVQLHDSDYAQRGTFTIGLEGVSPISPNPKPLVRGGIVGGTIEAAIDVKQFTFSGSKGDVISLALTSTATQGGFAAFANVYAPSGTNIDNFFATGQRYLTLDETGTFMVQLHDSDYAQKGSFTIGLEGVSPISPNPRRLVYGGFVTGTIDAPIDVKQFTFTARAGAVVGLSLTSTATQAGFAAFANVYAPSGTNIDNFFRTGLRYLTLEETGTYMVQLHDSDYAQKGSFKVGLEGISPPSPGAVRLVPRRTYSGRIAQSNDVVQYLLTVRADAAVRFTLTSRATQPGFAAYVEVFDPAGARVMSFFAGTRTVVMPVTGTYLIQVHDSDFAQTGTFTLRVG